MSQATKRGKKPLNGQDSKSQAPQEKPEKPQCARPASPTHTALQGMSVLLNTGLTTSELDTCIELLKAEIHPKALADFVRPLLLARRTKSDE